MNKRENTVTFYAVFLLVLVGLVSAQSLSQKYTAGESIPVWADRVGPFNNPQEFYSYYKLPFCKPETSKGQVEGLGESLLGYELRNTLFSISFGVPTRSGILCKRTFNELEFKKLNWAITHRYWYQLFIDELPVMGSVGEVVENGPSRQLYLYTHLDFDISRNGEHIVEVNVTSKGATLLKPNTEVSFSYSVTWRETSASVADRFDKYLDKAFHEHQVHWFSLFNALMLVAFLWGLVGIILLRTLKKDYVTLGEDDADDDLSDETGWKLLHRDVFRSPKRLVLFSALVGTGYQLATSLFLVLFLGALGAHYYEVRGSFLTGIFAWYILGSLVGGYTSGGLFARYKGTSWIKTTLAEASIAPLLFGVIGIIFSIIARSYGALSFIPFLTVFSLLILWMVANIPLTLVGTLFGRHLSNKAAGFPSGTQSIPRMIPQKVWYQQRWFLVLLSGLLPFSSIFIETYFVFSSLWHYKLYYTYGFALFGFVTLVVVVMSVGVIFTYFLLNSEDHRWQWNSYLSGASVGFYIFGYSLYHFFFRTSMTGFLQFTQFVSYSLIISLFVGLFCGSAGFFAASTFVNRIYRGLKAE